MKNSSIKNEYLKKIKLLHKYNKSYFDKSKSLITDQEFDILKNCKIIIALGKIGLDACVNFYKKKFNISKKIVFIHGKNYKLPDGKILFGCYHPSPRNLNTGRINLTKMTNLFLKTKKMIKV